MINFLRIAIPVLQIIAFAFFVYNLFGLLIMNATGHIVPHETNMYYGLRSVGGILVTGLCQLVRMIIK